MIDLNAQYLCREPESADTPAALLDGILADLKGVEAFCEGDEYFAGSRGENALESAREKIERLREILKTQSLQTGQVQSSP